MVFLDDEFIDKLNNSIPRQGMRMICEAYLAQQRNTANQGASPDSRYALAAHAFACLTEYAKSHRIDLPDLPNLTGTPKDEELIVAFFTKIESDIVRITRLHVINEYKKVYAMKFKTAFFYEFPQGDLERIQLRINELRSLISDSEDITVEHKQQLVKRLEKLHSELHKTMLDLDRLWGIVLEVGPVVERLGESAKPLVARIREIAEIVWAVQIRAQELPTNLPLRLPGNQPSED